MGRNSRGFPAERTRTVHELEKLALAARARLCPGLRAWDPFDGIELYERLHCGPLVVCGEEVPLDTRVAPLPPSVHGWVKYIPQDKEFELCLSERVYADLAGGAPEARFTFAHEIGHLVLHLRELLTLWGIPNMDRVLARATRHPLNADCEWQADEFGGRLLMPDAGLLLVEREIGQLAPAFVARRFNVPLWLAHVRLRDYYAKLRPR